MNCASCGFGNSNDALFCNGCGEPLTALALGLRRNQDAREKKTRELELTEAVAQRLMKWGKLFGWALGLVGVLLVLVLGKQYHDLQSAVDAGKTQIAEAVQTGTSGVDQSIRKAKTDIANSQRQLPQIQKDIEDLNTDITKYKKVNEHIDKLQSDLLRLQGDVINLSDKTLKVEKLEAGPAPGGGVMSFGQTGCDTAKGSRAAFSLCAQGNPPVLTTVNASGQARTVSGYSDTGFQDLSTGPKPACHSGLRGTLFVEKGRLEEPDHVFVCMRASGSYFKWVQVTTTEEIAH